jgi:hypothetical protein
VIDILSCAVCGKPLTISPYNRKKKYCSKQCCNADLKAQFVIRNNRGDMPLTAGTSGAVSELVVSVDLMRKGYHVFRAMSPSCPCDLVAFRGNCVLRVEVRTGAINVNGSIAYAKHQLDTHQYDVLAVVLQGSEVRYAPPLESLSTSD